MASNGKIYITISDERGKGGRPQGASGSGGGESAGKGKEALSSYITHQVFDSLKSTAIQAVNFSVNNIGNFTGDYVAQRNIQAGLGNAMKGIGYFTTAKVGMSVAGPWGAVVAVAVKGIGDMVSFGLQEKAQYTQNRRTNYQISEIRELSGLNTLIDGSRGTLS